MTDLDPMEPLLPGLHEFAAAVPFTPTADTRAEIDAAIAALRSTELFAVSREGAQQLLADIDAEVAQRVALACGPTPVPRHGVGGTIGHTYYLDTVVAGAGPGNNGADWAVFHREPDIARRFEPGSGEVRLRTADWIRRGRPTEVVVFIPEVS